MFKIIILNLIFDVKFTLECDCKLVLSHAGLDESVILDESVVFIDIEWVTIMSMVVLDESVILDESVLLDFQ